MGTILLYDINVKSCPCSTNIDDSWYKDRIEILGIFITSFTRVSLLYFSTIYNCESIGIVVLVLHDISDIFLAYGRTYADIGKNKIIVYVSFSAIQISWLYTRVYVFPIKIYDIIVYHPGFTLYWY